MIAVGSLLFKGISPLELSMTRNSVTCVNSERISELLGESLKIYLLECTESVISMLNHWLLTKSSEFNESSEPLLESDDSGMNFSTPTCSD